MWRTIKLVNIRAYHKSQSANKAVPHLCGVLFATEVSFFINFLIPDDAARLVLVAKRNFYRQGRQEREETSERSLCDLRVLCGVQVLSQQVLD